jgi:hypothetical protein
VYDRMVPAGLHPDGRIDLEALGASIDAYRTVGALTEATEASSAVDHQYVDYARERLGPYQP